MEIFIKIGIEEGGGGGGATRFHLLNSEKCK